MIRNVASDDIDEIYDLLIKVELGEPIESSCKEGFLMTAYSLHPEERARLQSFIGRTYFYAYTERGNILGCALAFSGSEWKKAVPKWGEPKEGNIRWFTESLRKVGIHDISSLLEETKFAVLEKVAVDPAARRRGICRQLCERIFSELKRGCTNYVFVEIVENAYGNGKSLGIVNQNSIKVFEGLGAVKVGESKKPYKYNKSFLGDRGFFSDLVYIVPLDQKIMSQKRFSQEHKQ
jgi:ribosomal protein S18 acetylase RimI-like enzyme